MIRTPTSPEVLEAAGRGDLGLVVRLSRRARRETQEQTAAACGFTQSDISRLERGQRHTHDIRVLQKLATHLNIPPRLLGLAEDPAELMEPPVDRREFITGAAAALAAAALPKLDGEPTEHFAELRTVTATYRRMDSTLPSYDLVRPVAAQLDMVHGLLQRTADPRTKAWLAQSASEAASLAAWLAWDRSDYTAAEAYYRKAVKLADAADHPLLTSYQLGSLATLMIDRHDRKAVDVLALARHKLGPHPSAVADSWIASLEGLANATVGYADAAWSALDRADMACSRIDNEPPPWPWVFHFGQDKIAAQRVVCAARLSQPTRVLSSLPLPSQTDGGHRRQQALFSLDLAEVHIQAGDTDGGVDLATRSLELVNGYRSGRVLHRAAALRHRNARRLSRRHLEALDDTLRRAS